MNIRDGRDGKATNAKRSYNHLRRTERHMPAIVNDIKDDRPHPERLRCDLDPQHRVHYQGAANSLTLKRFIDSCH